DPFVADYLDLRANLLRFVQVKRETVRSEVRGKQVRRRAQKRVRAGPVARRNDNDRGRRLERGEKRLDVGGRDKRNVDRKAEQRPNALSRTETRRSIDGRAFRDLLTFMDGAPVPLPRQVERVGF